MPTRRFHSKTRSGCLQCKERKTKCDEDKPVCKNCAKRQVTCSFTLSPSALVVVNSQHMHIASSVKGDHTKQHVNRLTCEDNRPPDNEISLAKTYALKGDDNDTLRLMYHYALSTCFSISDLPSSIPPWRDTVPALAFEHDFLLSGLLGVTSLHLVLLNPSAHHTNAAIKHYSQALTLIQPHLSNVTPDNVSALFSCSCLIALYSFGIHCTSQSCLDPLADILELFSLIRGIAVIVKNRVQWLERGPFAQAMLPTLVDSNASLAPEIDAALETLSQRNLETIADPKAQEAYATTIEMLRQTLLLAAEKPDTKMTALLFPIMVPPLFMDELRYGNSMALLILAHYGVVLYWLRSHIWLRGWGSQIVEAVKGVVGGDSRGCLDWPLKVVG